MANITYNPVDIANKRFGGPGGTAQTSTPEQLAVKQAVLTRGSTIAERSVDLSANSAPAKATGAPVAGKENIFTGLCEALNQNQQELVKLKKREIPDQYVIEFTPASMGASTVKRPGAQDATTAPMQTSDTANKVNKEINKVNRVARTWPIEAGTQIIKVIDDVMRNSSFVTDQQNVEITTATDAVTGIQTQELNAKKGTGNFLWYKISVATHQLGFDKIIRDHAYRMTFIITPYAVAQMTSQYFPDSRYRGVHKSYQYWFTGANTQILHYEQSYNNAYRLLLSGIGIDQQKSSTTDFRDQNRYIFMATSENQSKGAKNYANEPGNNAASFLYDPMSLSKVKLRIIGDPAWMQQGECGLGVSAKSFNFNPFNADGSINYDSQAVMFDVSFNQPTDYNFSTGLMDVTAKNRNGLPQEHYTFTAVTCKNFFSKGRFEQEIEGKLLIEKKTNQNKSNDGRPAAPAAPAAAGSRDTTNSLAGSGYQNEDQQAADGNGATTPDDGSRGYAIQDETGQVSNIRKNEYGDLYYPVTPQPAAPPAAPTSSGDIASSDTTAPQNASTSDKVLANADETAAVNAYIAAGGTFPKGTGPITSGPLFDNVVAAKESLTARQQAAAVPAATSVAPQIMNKEY